MGYTKILSIDVRLDNSLNYISNPEKTDVKLDMDSLEGKERYIKNDDKTEKGLYVQAFNCSKKNAYKRMLKTQEKKGKSHRIDGVLGYHIIQSFKDFETTPEIAHKAGTEFVRRLFADNYEAVVATHLDKDHLHNHIIINSVSFKSGYKYRNNFKDYFGDIRGYSDQICREYCLTVIKPEHRGMNYAEWLALQNGKKTIRGQVRQDLDDIIKGAYTMNEFWKMLEERGFVICRRAPKYEYTSFIPPYGTKQIRLDKLGPEYTEDAIRERIITARNKIRTASPTELPKRKVYKYKGDLKNMKSIKLKGFKALYFHYMYFFKIVPKKSTPQRVSFFMRDEMIKLERYQRQFKFLYKNNIETGTQLSEFQKTKEREIDDLVNERKMLYSNRTEENADEVKDEAEKINTKLRELRKDVKMCKAIAVDSYKISRKYEQAKALIKQAELEVMQNEHKRRGR